MRRVFAVISLIFVLAACSSAATPTSTATTPAASTPIWQTLPLVDARDGSTFTLADFKGRTVYVEPMATWCTNCRAQFGNVKTFRAQKGYTDESKVVFVGLSVETNLKPEDLAAYMKNTGFDWRFAVMTPQMLSELTTQFGITIANPPSTPHFVIYPDGRVSPLSSGAIDSVEMLAKLIDG